MHDKLLDSISFKCSPEFKRLLVQVAMAKNMDASDFVRCAIEAEIEKERAAYEALHAIFGSANETTEDLV
jgi:hypothetical protein